MGARDAGGTSRPLAAALKASLVFDKAATGLSDFATTLP
jgi:hypothetical protein